MLWGLSFGVLSAAWPLYLQELGAAPRDIGLVFGAGNFVALLCFLPVGYVADRIGRKPMIVGAWVCAALGVAAFVPLGDWRAAFLGSALYWSGTAAIPLVLAHVSATVPRARLASALGLIFGAFFAGNIVGSPIAGLVAAPFGLRTAVAVAALFLGLSAALTFGLRATPPTRERGEFTVPRAFWALLAITPFAALLSILGNALLPVYLHDVAAVPLERVGVYVGFVWLGSAIGAMALGRLADELGSVPAIMGAAAVATFGAILIALSGRSEAVIAVAALALGATQAANPVVAAAVERFIPSARMALGYASYQVAFALGFGSGGAVSGILYEADPLLPFLATAALALPVATVVGVVISRATSPQPASPIA